MAKRKKRELTQTRVEYNKQRKRIQNFISRAEKKGYIFDENIIPAIPKRVTKASVSRLAKLTSKELYKKAVYVSRETGEIETPEEHKSRVRKEATQKAKATKARKKAQKEKKQDYPQPEKSKRGRKKKTNTDRGFYTRAVIETFLYTLETCRNGKAYPLLLRWFNKLRADNGDEAVAEMLTKGAENGYEVSWSVVYDVEKATDFTQGIIQFLSEQGDFYQDEMDEFWNELSAMENAMYEDSNFERY
jgi:hypothetical protein